MGRDLKGLRRQNLKPGAPRKKSFLVRRRWGGGGLRSFEYQMGGNAIRVPILQVQPPSQTLQLQTPVIAMRGADHFEIECCVMPF